MKRSLRSTWSKITAIFQFNGAISFPLFSFVCLLTRAEKSDTISLQRQLVGSIMTAVMMMMMMMMMRRRSRRRRRRRRTAVANLNFATKLNGEYAVHLNKGHTV